MEYKFNYGVETDYNRFQIIGENREIKSPHAQKIAQSIKNINLIGANPIIVANDLIIDGQHRFNACRILGIPVPYIEIIGMSSDEMIKAMYSLNSNAKNWGLGDYLKLYVKQGKENYILLNKFMDDYGISISIAIYMLQDFNDFAYKNASESSGFKDGLFTPINYARATEKAIALSNIRDMIGADFRKHIKLVKSAGFIKAFLKIATQQENIFDATQMKLALKADLKSNKPMFRKFESVEEYYNVLVDIYNSRNPKDKLDYYLAFNSKRVEVEDEE